MKIIAAIAIAIVISMSFGTKTKTVVACDASADHAAAKANWVKVLNDKNATDADIDNALNAITEAAKFCVPAGFDK